MHTFNICYFFHVVKCEYVQTSLIKLVSLVNCFYFFFLEVLVIH